MKGTIAAETEIQTPFLNLSSHSQEWQAVNCNFNFMPKTGSIAKAPA